MLGLAVSLGCLYLVTRGTDWTAVGAILAGTRPGWVRGMIGVGLLTLVIRAQRWRVLLRPVGEVGFEPSLSATAIGFGASAVLPLRLGELVRPALLGRRARIGLSPALSSVVVERLFDMLVVIGCALLTGLVSALGYSTLLWAVIALTWTCGLLALALPVPLLAASLTVMVTVAAFVFLPQGPGFVGTWQAGCVLALTLFGTPRETAIGYSLLTWLGMMGTNLLAGGVFLAREDVSVRELLRVAAPDGPAAPVEG